MIASALLRRAGRLLCWSDADTGSRGTILDPRELVGLRAIAWVHGVKAVDAKVGALSQDSDNSEVEFMCVGPRRGHAITDAGVVHLVQALLRERELPPDWCTMLADGSVRFLLIDDSEPSCRRHRDSTHRAAWMCRAWVAARGASRAVDLSGLGSDRVLADLMALESEARP